MTRATARLVAIPIALLAACGPTGPTTSPAPSGSPAPQVVAEAPPFPGSAGATEWQTTIDMPAGMGMTDTDYQSATVLLAAFRTLIERGGEPGTTSGLRVGFIGQPTEREAVAFVYVGAADDAIAGAEYRLFMAVQRRGWFIGRVETRTHCRRGVDATTGQCL